VTVRIQFQVYESRLKSVGSSRNNIEHMPGSFYAQFSLVICGNNDLVCNNKWEKDLNLVGAVNIEYENIEFENS